MKPENYSLGGIMDLEEHRRLQGQERGERLDDILSRWHWWRAAYTPWRDVGGGGNATDDYLASRQYDDQNGALDDAIENNIMRQVDFEVDQLPEMLRTAVCAIARALYVGAKVFHSPRIPAERRAAVEMEARAAITVRLISAGVLTS